MGDAVCKARLIRVFSLFLVFCASGAASQELEPRALSPSPIGTKFFFSGFGTSQGSVVVDTTLPIQDIQAKVSSVLAGSGYTFDLGGYQARVLALLPYTWGSISGDIAGEGRSRKLEGLLDPSIKFTVGLLGAPALTPDEFLRTPRTTVAGASLTITPPIGRYDSTRLINLGRNRWAFKPEIGFWHPWGRWTLDGSVGLWLFTANNSYFPGTATLEQDSIVALQGHVSYDFKGGVWIALDGAWFSGGQTHVNDMARPDRQTSTRMGATLSLPMSREQSIKITYATGIATRRGADFDTIVISWQLVRF